MNHPARTALISLGLMWLAHCADVTGSQRVSPSPSMPRSQGGGTGGISPVVVAQWITHRVAGVENLELLILWRGSPGWFMQPGGYGDAGGSPGTHSTWMKVGPVDVSMTFDEPTRRITIQGGAPIALGANNVVFVDDVESPNGPRMVGSMTVPRAMPGSAGQIAPILRSSPRIMSFLRCEAGQDAPNQARLKMMCLENVGVER